MIEAVALAERECMWIDEEGLLAEPHQPLFQIGPHTIAGRALCLGLDHKGDVRASRLPVDALFAAVVFRPDLELKGWKKLDGSTIVETAFGPMPLFGDEPIFGLRDAKDVAA